MKAIILIAILAVAGFLLSNRYNHADLHQDHEALASHVFALEAIAEDTNARVRDNQAKLTKLLQIAESCRNQDLDR